MPKIRNIIIFIVIAAAIFLAYVFFIKPSLSSSDQANLVSTSNTALPSAVDASANTQGGDSVAQNFLTLLLSVKTIKLNVAIFSDPAFIGLRDSSITLTPDATTGRPNPFAQFGSGNTGSSTSGATDTTAAATDGAAATDTITAAPIVTPSTPAKTSKNTKTTKTPTKTTTKAPVTPTTPPVSTNTPPITQ